MEICFWMYVIYSRVLATFWCFQLLSNTILLSSPNYSSYSSTVALLCNRDMGCRGVVCACHGPMHGLYISRSTRGMLLYVQEVSLVRFPQWFCVQLRDQRGRSHTKGTSSVTSEASGSKGRVQVWFNGHTIDINFVRFTCYKKNYLSIHLTATRKTLNASLLPSLSHACTGLIL